ncbi:cellulose biosynthesis cyclic di-GMP-binding regulatory protein BcsB [Paraburkholderia sp.]|uniref:cellulose biosynthesis cyclic di-GMP-binding regulatory protein BcsB n=1 Tax=Paraburkholderia sp. TaxID=1926495 RepID=UPI002397CACB|nr:cellulose biosynthesis cyclic di-GMP-binding regulatory protein BcsB [Paraburkholderia sp.]MDE1180695.1 cellulose biosynthesis cyclic di-GMP-binding regulatory protein BcsB [Paraburkholderia sp.]
MIIDTSRLRNPQVRAAVRVGAPLAAAFVLLHAGVAGAASADLASGFAQLGQGELETRTATLKQLGLLQSVTLTAPDTRREFFLPVPADIPISDATLQFDGAYVRGDGGRTTMLLSLDGSPVASRSFTQDEGNVSMNLGVDGAPRAAGFVRVGLGYASVISDNVCTDQTAIGNVLRVDPSTRLSYRFNPADVKDLRSAWSALPYAPVLTIAGTRLGAASLDTAWRTDALLQRDGKRPVTQAIPAVGASVDLGGLNVPASLQGVPAFDALARAASAGGKLTIANPAELGALIALAPRQAFGPDVVVADAPLRDTLNGALDALRAQIASAGAADATSALAAFDAWRARAVAPVTTPLARGEVRVAHLGARAVIVVGDNDGVAVLGQGWRPIDVSNRVVVHQIDPGARTQGDAILLSDLGGDPRSVDVHDTSSWSASFDLAAASGKGQLPAEVVLDLASSPTLSGGGATATVYFNDVMIGAKLLDTGGTRQRLAMEIPRYALARTNDLRVTFRRQPDAGCQARQAYPVAVLPSSFLRLSDGTPDNDFVGMAARYASAATVIVPQAYLDDAVNSIPRLATLTGATGVAPLPAKFQVMPNGETAHPDTPFLAVDVPVADEKNHAGFSKDRLTLTSAAGDRLIDVSGLSHLAVLSVAQSGDQSGIVFRSTGTPPVLTDKLQLSRGDIVVVDSSGVLKRFDTVHPDDLSAGGGSSTEWVTRHWARWGIPALSLLLLILLILLARAARRKERRQRDDGSGPGGAGGGSNGSVAPTGVTGSGTNGSGTNGASGKNGTNAP